MTRGLLISLLISAVWCAPTSAVVTFDWATVGNPGNADDNTGYGGVDYVYRISKHEVTNAQYMEFLNAVATVGDAHGLYSTRMAATYGGIARSGSGTFGDPYAYSVKGGDSNWLGRPVNYVSFLDAMRFTNWLNNGQGSGDTESGAYTIGSGTDEVRSASAKYWIPGEDEWYKAAYYDASAGVYYDYPTGTDSPPGNDLINPDPGNNANFYQSGYTIGYPYYTTEVGEFENSASPYGTFDQGGNVWEWNEAVINSSYRGFRGGSFGYLVNILHADYRIGVGPSSEDNFVGFRVTTVPEPKAVALASLGLLGIIARKRYPDDDPHRGHVPDRRRLPLALRGSRRAAARFPLPGRR